ncbi:MAG: hypothetical protein JXR69_01905 [Candidatus Delongbacteria bacterium]|nr:hypothetical protein [Candidatus Delongbacteria bacterium]
MTETNFTVVTQLSGSTSNYSRINYYLGKDSIPVVVIDNDELDSLVEDSQFTVTVNTIGYVEGDYDLIVETIATDQTTETVTVPIYLILPYHPPLWIDFDILTPDDSSEFTVGDTINFEVAIMGYATSFIQFEAFIDSSNVPFYETPTFDDSLIFNCLTDSLSVGIHSIKFELKDIYSDIREKRFNFSLIDSIK